MIIGIDAKRIVRNGTGLGSYGRTLVNDLIRLGDSDLQLRLYAPDEGRDDLRGQIIEGAEFCYPKGHPAGGELISGEAQPLHMVLHLADVRGDDARRIPRH